MLLSQIKNKNIAIKTYCFESGLYYLADTLRKELEQDNKILFIPKEKYIQSGHKYTRSYISTLPNTEEFDNTLSPEKNLELFLLNNKIDIIISFETLTLNTAWIRLAKSKGIYIIDIPMPEWIIPEHLNKYEIFDDIWCINSLSESIFKNHKHTKTKWNFADQSLFYKDKKNDIFTFYHPGSTSEHYSSKSTKEVIDAFCALNINAQLIITGRNIEPMLNNKSSYNITCKSLVSRSEQADILRKSHALVSPSAREGHSLVLYEAQACGTEIITSDHKPMSDVKTKYLCKPKAFKAEKNSLIKSAIITPEEIQKNMRLCYNDLEK